MSTNPTTSGPIATCQMITVDCGDSRAEAAFWSAVLGVEPIVVEDEYAMLPGPGGGPALGFGTVADHVAPGWPNERGSKQFHLDLAVDDLAAAERRCVELGATLPADQPGGDRWRVLLDPAGHPFCLTLAANWS